MIFRTTVSDINYNIPFWISWLRYLFVFFSIHFIRKGKSFVQSCIKFECSSSFPFKAFPCLPIYWRYPMSFIKQFLFNSILSLFVFHCYHISTLWCYIFKCFANILTKRFLMRSKVILRMRSKVILVSLLFLRKIKVRWEVT